MSAPSIPFFAQTAVLDKYIHSSTPEEEPEILEIILEAIKSKPELREYFFRNGPHPAWAKILWEHGFFRTPPLPLETKEGSYLRQWDVQIYLDMVASQVPEIVLQHVLEFQGHDWYIFRALHALLETPVGTIEQAIPKILDWLQDPIVASRIGDISCDLMFKIAENGQKESAFILFKALTSPIQKAQTKSVRDQFWSGTAVKIVAEHLLDRQEQRQSQLQTLAKLDLLQYCEILEENLRALLNLESQVYERPSENNSSWWRTAIEDTSQDSLDRDRDRLLSSLRDGLETQLEIDTKLVLPFIARYLSDLNRLFCRLGIYFLSVRPDYFLKLVTPILLSPENFSDNEIHHEFFVLLEKAFHLLTHEQQGTVLSIILNGPHQDELIIFGQKVSKKMGGDASKLTENYIKYWRRDRLWMIKEDLLPEYRNVLDEIVTELGKPEHPTFLTWTSEGYWIKDVAPLSDLELANIKPEELVRFLENWTPDPQQKFGPIEISYEGMADSLGKLITTSLDKYSPYLFELAAARADYAIAVLDQLCEPSYEIQNWDILLNLCESLLADITIRSNAITARGNWTWVRRSIISLLKKGLRKETPYEQLQRFRDLLLILVDDPSPTSEEDRPPEGWFGHGDPATVALNYARPMAVNALIEYARVRAIYLKISDHNYSGPNRLEDQVQQSLSRKLIPSLEPSLAVRSVFGHSTAVLYWLNKEWWLSNLDLIFPWVVDNESLLLFAAAWDSFVTNPFYIHLIEHLRPKYLQAIALAAKGQTTGPSFYSPVSYLARHLLWEYLLGNAEIEKPISLEDSLLKIFFDETTPESRGLAVAACNHLLRSHSTEIIKYWPKIRILWEWRAQEASLSGYAVDFQDEMIHFARMLPLVPETETVSSLWSLLETLLPYVTRSKDRYDEWNSIEKFLLMRFEREPIRSIQYYSLLWDQRIDIPRWLHHSEEAVKLVTIAVENPTSRQEALHLVDFLARKGNYTFKPLYESYSH